MEAAGQFAQNQADALNRERKMEEDKLEYARYEQETELLGQGQYMSRFRRVFQMPTPF